MVATALDARLRKAKAFLWFTSFARFAHKVLVDCHLRPHVPDNSVFADDSKEDRAFLAPSTRAKPLRSLGLLSGIA